MKVCQSTHLPEAVRTVRDLRPTYITTKHVLHVECQVPEQILLTLWVFEAWQTFARIGE